MPSPSGLARFRRFLGTLRSLCIYWRPGRQRGLQRFYSQFMAAGDLVFDLGAHVGDRSAAFARLGARVVALEPQPQLLPVLRRAVRGAGDVTVIASAVGASPGEARLRLCSANPTVSSLSADWMSTVTRSNPGFSRVSWDDDVTVPVTTLDALIADHGVPAFCKIDVEGFESAVLAGLTQPVPALSFEFVPGTESIALACVERLDQLGDYRYNIVLGEQRGFVLPDWQASGAIRHWLETHGCRQSGDVYARQYRP